MPSRMGPGDCLVARAVGAKPWAFYPRLELPLSPVSFLQSIQRHFNFNFGQHLAFLIKNVILPKTLTVLAQVCLIIAKTLPPAAKTCCLPTALFKTCALQLSCSKLCWLVSFVRADLKRQKNPKADWKSDTTHHIPNFSIFQQALQYVSFSSSSTYHEVIIIMDRT